MSSSKKTLLVIAAALFCFSAFGQSKAETKLYEKTVASPSLKTLDKFLKKYPSSVYAPDIAARKDTILNISPFSMNQAEEIALPFFGIGASVKAYATRSEAVDRINVIAVVADTLQLGDMRIAVLVRDPKNGWSVESSYDRNFFNPGEFTSASFVDSCYVVKMRGKDCIFFNVLLNSSSDARGYVASAFIPSTDELSQVLFSGKSILAEGETGYRILGRSDNWSKVNSPEVNILNKFIDDNQRLEKISDADFHTDAALEFWLEKNPDALTTATKVTASVISPLSSLIEQYQNARGKQNSTKYRAALVDFRGYTMIIVYQKATEDYVLAWVEPECKDHNTDRLLNSIEFRDANTLELFYYQGKKFFKYHLNLASKTLSRK